MQTPQTQGLQTQPSPALQAQQTQQAQLINVLDLSKETEPGQGQPQLLTPARVSEGGDNTDEGIVLDNPLLQGVDTSPGEDGDKKLNRPSITDPSKYRYTLKGQEKNMCGSGYSTYPKFLPPYLKLFSQNSEVGRE